MGNLLYVKVHSATESDTKKGRHIAYQAFRRYSSLKGFCADQGYRGTTKDFIENELKMRIDITSKISNSGFHVIPKRWIVERFFAWINNFRRLSKDYELSAHTSEQIIIVAAIVLVLNRF
jgi:transposase